MSTTSPVEPLLVPPLRSEAARKQARLRAQMTWRRVAVRLLLGGIASACLVRVGAIALEPLVATYRSGRSIQVLEGQYHTELARRNHLQREIQFLATNDGIEEEARRLGWVKEGETSLQTLTPGPLATDPFTPPSPPKKLSGSERVKQWLGTWMTALSHKVGRAHAKRRKG